MPAAHMPRPPPRGSSQEATPRAAAAAGASMPPPRTPPRPAAPRDREPNRTSPATPLLTFAGSEPGAQARRSTHPLARRLARAAARRGSWSRGGVSGDALCTLGDGDGVAPAVETLVARRFSPTQRPPSTGGGRRRRVRARALLQLRRPRARERPERRLLVAVFGRLRGRRLDASGARSDNRATRFQAEPAAMRQQQRF